MPLTWFCLEQLTATKIFQTYFLDDERMNQYIFDVQKKGLANEQNLIWSEIQMLIFYVFRKLLTSLMQINESFRCWRETCRNESKYRFSARNIIEIRWHRDEKHTQKFFSPPCQNHGKVQECRKCEKKHCRLLIYDYAVLLYCRNWTHILLCESACVGGTICIIMCGLFVVLVSWNLGIRSTFHVNSSAVNKVKPNIE